MERVNLIVEGLLRWLWPSRNDNLYGQRAVTLLFIVYVLLIW